MRLAAFAHEPLPADFLQVLQHYHLSIPAQALIVRVSSQKLLLYANHQLAAVYSISTAKNGIGQQVNTFCTPLGLHRVAEKVGKGERPYTIFRYGKSTKKVWTPGTAAGNDLILTRVLILEGLEYGLNRGQDKQGRLVDSFERRIYIHATPEEELLGTPASHGCVRMSTKDILELFPLVHRGTLVWIAN